MKVETIDLRLEACAVMCASGLALATLTEAGGYAHSAGIVLAAIGAAPAVMAIAAMGVTTFAICALIFVPAAAIVMAASAAVDIAFVAMHSNSAAVIFSVAAVSAAGGFYLGKFSQKQEQAREV